MILKENIKLTTYNRLMVFVMTNFNSDFYFREAKIDDVPQLQLVRNSVAENILSDPAKVTDEMVANYLTSRGKGWICEAENRIIGFSIVDLEDENVWELFVRPEYVGAGIGKRLHNLMLNWYFGQGKQNIWLSTEPHTRAADFYRKQGWKEAGTYGSDEIKFELTAGDWQGK